MVWTFDVLLSITLIFLFISETEQCAEQCFKSCLLFRLSGRERAKESIQESSVETILVATDRLFASTGDAGEMVRQARVLGQATAQLIQAIKVRSRYPPPLILKPVKCQ